MRKPEELLSAMDAAEVLGVSRPTVLRWVHEGRLKPFKKFPGRTNPYTFHRDEVTRVLVERQLAPKLPRASAVNQ